jgi:hypothetical protein
MSGNAMAGVVSQIQDYAYGYSMKRIVTDAADVLIKTPGEPLNWNSTNPPITLGLAKYEDNETITHFLDDRKVGAMNSSYLTQLIGTRFTYYNLTIVGLQNVSFSWSWSVGARANASDIAAARRIAFLEMWKIAGELDEIARVPIGEKACCVKGGKQPIVTYAISFYVEPAETAIFDFWIVGEKRIGDNSQADAWVYGETDPEFEGLDPDCCWVSGGEDKIDLFPVPGDCKKNECGDPCDATCCSETTAEFDIIRVKIDDELTEGMTNYVFIRLTGNPWTETTYYVIRAPAGICNDLIIHELAKPQPVLVILEAGR